MAEKFLADTCFIIDLLREQKKNKPGAASRFLASHPEASIFLSIISVGELEEGFAAHGFTHIQEILAPFPVIYLSRTTAGLYGRHSAKLRIAGNRFGDNDLWIAVSGIEHALPLLSVNTKHFLRIDELSLVDYGKPS